MHQSRSAVAGEVVRMHEAVRIASTSAAASACAFTAVALAFAAGCSLLVDAGGLSTASESSGAPDGSLAFDAGSGEDDGASSSSDASTDGGPTTDAADGGCPDASGPKMVRVTDSFGTFCIDGTEVTNRQMNAFINSTLRPVAPAECSFKTSYGGAIRPDDDLPVTQVDWCDAWMYCAWAGKRLCGSRNGTKIDDFPPANDPKVSEWFAACSLSGTRDFPYPGPSDPNACNGCQRTSSCGDGGGSPMLPVASLATCEGGYPGLFDMLGNVNEWEDNCNGNQCPPRGGANNNGGADLACAITQLLNIDQRDEKGARTGIRCCAN